MKKNKKQPYEPTIFYEFHKDYGFWGIPNKKGEVYFGYEKNKLTEVSHNSLGLREEELKDTIKPSILCCGGSNTWGAGVDQDKRYTDFLKKTQHYKVINMGHCSLGLDQVILAIMKNAEKYNAKIIFIEQYTWALHRVITKSVNGYIRPNFTFGVGGELLLNQIPSYFKYRPIRNQIAKYHQFKKELNEFLSGIDIKDNYDAKIDPIFLSWKTAYYQNMYDLLHALIGLLNSFCKNKGIKLLFGLAPLKHQMNYEAVSELIDFNLPNKKFSTILYKHGIDFIDTSNQMLHEHKKDAVIYQDGHMNNKGHFILSKLIHDKLKHLNWIESE